MERVADTARSVERGRDSADAVTELQKNAARIQHAMNNPLAALLAEEQLLSMETTLSAEQRESVDRMIELTRRVIVLVRDLDELRGSHPPR
jgi:light-regulated signal transduction histidine kinase (bacteriophytochrome)